MHKKTDANKTIICKKKDEILQKPIDKSESLCYNTNCGTAKALAEEFILSGAFRFIPYFSKRKEHLL